jgi:hypothetical protein
LVLVSGLQKCKTRQTTKECYSKQHPIIASITGQSPRDNFQPITREKRYRLYQSITREKRQKTTTMGSYSKQKRIITGPNYSRVKPKLQVLQDQKRIITGPYSN